MPGRIVGPATCIASATAEQVQQQNLVAARNVLPHFRPIARVMTDPRQHDHNDFTPSNTTPMVVHLPQGRCHEAMQPLAHAG
eukprot:CAMPEP_0180793164 /NCGR_PEP_ID=MMETSP1038_2-20121128/54836_1 /TAXON_ID=632150 /ORGANISM="Azadinium spinosum, Strain 3D9" /LENGTH=81 /DNA_ID=CAMNT_0022831631 /DNA_START=11 /DNA_END=256 /DNA_ORIENTATION=-